MECPLDETVFQKFCALHEGQQESDSECPYKAECKSMLEAIPKKDLFLLTSMHHLAEAPQK